MNTTDLTEVPLLERGFKIKIKAIKGQLCELKKFKHEYHSLFLHYKKKDLVFRIILNLCNAVTLSSIVLTFVDTNYIFMYVSLGFSSLSTIIGALYSTLDLPSKATSAQTSWLQIKDLYNTYNAKLLRNHLSSQEYDTMLEEINVKIGLVLDSGLPVEVSEIRLSIRGSD